MWQKIKFIFSPISFSIQSIFRNTLTSITSNFLWVGEAVGFLRTTSLPLPPLLERSSIQARSLIDTKHQNKIEVAVDKIRTGSRYHFSIYEKLTADVSNFILAPYLNIEDTANFAAVSHTFNRLFQKNLSNFLALHVVHGEFDKVCKILKKRPELLLNKTTVKDYSGRRIRGTVYGIILGTWDIQLINEAKAALVKFAGIDEADKQYHIQFPIGWEQEEVKTWLPLFDQLKVLDKTIRTTTARDITSSKQHKLTVRKSSNIAIELAKFHALLTATTAHQITTGRHFNLNFLEAVLNCYSKLCKDFDYSTKRCKLF